jgi:hypothetical protein
VARFRIRYPSPARVLLFEYESTSAGVYLTGSETHTQNKKGWRDTPPTEERTVEETKEDIGATLPPSAPRNIPEVSGLSHSTATTTGAPGTNAYNVMHSSREVAKEIERRNTCDHSKTRSAKVVDDMSAGLRSHIVVWSILTCSHKHYRT